MLESAVPFGGGNEGSQANGHGEARRLGGLLFSSPRLGSADADHPVESMDHEYQG